MKRISRLLAVAVLLAPSSSGFVIYPTPTATTRQKETPTALFGFASEMARKLGKLVGEATHDSEWNQIPKAFQEGVEESEINARARNAKPMEALPQELPSSVQKNASASVSSNLKETLIVDVDVLDANEATGEE